MKKELKSPELLAPAGTLEKLKIAVHYGADAVYIGGEAYGLRSQAGNFTYEEMEEAVEFAHNHGVAVHVATNMVSHQGDEKGAGEFFRSIQDIGVDAVIISDPALMQICATDAPSLDMHLSTQQSAVNYETLNFWQEAGLTRCVLGREVSMEEIAEIQEKTDVEVESFIHGAMCISYSGRCTLSNHMSHRDANRGGCSQSCRWKYGLYDMPARGEKYAVGAGEIDTDITEEYSMSATDLSMINHIPDIIDNGIDSLKIEGRMKSIHYVSTVVNVYRKAIDSYLEDPENYELDPAWVDELWKACSRELNTGFFYGKPDENFQLFGERRRKQEYKFVGEVLDYDEETGMATIQQRNVLNTGDEIEVYGPGLRVFKQTLGVMTNADGEEITRANHPMEIVTMKMDQPVKAHDILRRAILKKDGKKAKSLQEQA